MIFHLVPELLWPPAGDYRPASLETEGFVHCSAHDQVLATANRFYAGRDDLLLLTIDPDRLASEVRWEEGEPGERFPHVYGPLDRVAVLAVVPLRPGPDGAFVRLP